MSDIKAIFKYSSEFGRRYSSGFRPAVLIKEDYLTTCLLTFSNNINSNEEFEVEGVFISPEYYPHSLWVGKVLDIYEGAKIIGHITVTEILNPILCKMRYF